MLHQKRTGRALYITKDIVEKEAMYEEIDNRYQEKRTRMLHVHNLHIEEELNRHLAAALAVRTKPASVPSVSPAPVPPVMGAMRSASASSASPGAPHHRSQHHHRRASSMNPRPSMNGVRKLSLDLSQLRSSLSEGRKTAPLTSPMVMDQGYSTSPGYNTFPQQNHQQQQQQQPEWYFPQVSSSYVQQPLWSQNWTGFQPRPQQQQQHIIQDMSQMPTPFPMRQRFASAPEISLHGLPTDTLPMMPPTPTPEQQQQQHSRVRSEPNVSIMMMQPEQLQAPFSQTPSPTTQPTLDMSSTPISTPPSPKSINLETYDAVPQPGLGAFKVPQVDALAKGSEGMFFSSNDLDPDFDDFSQYAFRLGNFANMGERNDVFGFDEMVPHDFTAAA